MTITINRLLFMLLHDLQTRQRAQKSYVTEEYNTLTVLLKFK